ncbi:MAG TPA: tetratricopeptide repeat protein [Blastocatellia bacterium]|nr:tetratricopeptide repeat protein [Blastocatellia bacterium]
MRRSRTATILLYCFFSLFVLSRHSAFAQQPPQANEKERGIELYSKGNFSEAVGALKEAVKKQRKDSEAWYYLGLSLHRVGEIKDARNAFEKAISLKPDFAPGYTAMAYMQLFSDDYKGAVKNAEKAVALDPKNFESFYIAGAARLRQKQTADALAKAEEALKIKPDYSQALILKTETLISMFAREREKLIESLGRREEGKSSGDAEHGAKKRLSYSLLKAASESLEAYLKLEPEQSDHAFWSEQLEALRFYAQREDGPISDKPVTSTTTSSRPTILYREKADYTQEARLAGVQGTVILMVVFADEGVLKHILVLQGLSHGLTGQAIAAARKVRFTPAMRDGKPTPVIGSLEYFFNLY